MKVENHLVQITLTPAVTSYKIYVGVLEEVEADYTILFLVLKILEGPLSGK